MIVPRTRGWIFQGCGYALLIATWFVGFHWLAYVGYPDGIVVGPMDREPGNYMLPHSKVVYLPQWLLLAKTFHLINSATK